MFSKTSSVSIITTNDQNIEFSEIIHVLTNAILTQLDNPTWVISGVATIDATTHLRAQTNQQKKICYIL